MNNKPSKIYECFHPQHWIGDWYANCKRSRDGLPKIWGGPRAVYGSSSQEERWWLKFKSYNNIYTGNDSPICVWCYTDCFDFLSFPFWLLKLPLCRSLLQGCQIFLIRPGQDGFLIASRSLSLKTGLQAQKKISDRKSKLKKQIAFFFLCCQVQYDAK